jgi:succinate-acetate transporter protein
MSTTRNEGPTVETTSGAASAAAADPTKGFGDPGPLGLAAFALTTFLLSLFNAGIAPENLEKTVLPLALFYGGLAQLIAGLFEFRKANTFGATAFVSYGAFWLSFAAFVQFVEPAIPEASAKTATGLFLLGWAIFTLYMFIASLKTSGALIAVFLFLFLTFLALVLGTLLGVSALATVGGILGIVTAIAAWYASFAVVTNETYGRQVLPTGPR